MEWSPTAVAVEARHAHLRAEAERRRLVRLARRGRGDGLLPCTAGRWWSTTVARTTRRLVGVEVDDGLARVTHGRTAVPG